MAYLPVRPKLSLPEPLAAADPVKQPITQINFCKINDFDQLPMMESHLNWIPQAERSEERISKHLEKLNSWLNDVEDVEVVPLTIMGQRFIKLAMVSYLNKVEDGDTVLDELNDLIEELSGNFTYESVLILQYLLECEKTYFWYRRGNMDQAEKHLLAVQERYSKDLLNKKAESTLLALKGLLMGHLGLSRERLSLFREAVKLDPQSSDLYGYLYSSIRRVRREENYGSGPNAEEIEACRKAYDLLEEKTSAVLLRMTNMYEETLMSFNKDQIQQIFDMTVEQMRDELIFFIKTAAELNPNSISTNVKLADVLSHGVTKDLEQCEKQYKLCLEKWPKNSQVLHKVGKFNVCSKGDLEAGLELMERALETDSDNFPCLMDYLRFKSNNLGRGDSLMSFIPICDRYISNFENKAVFKSKLLGLKGCILWLQCTPSEAIISWVEAVKVDPKALQRKLLDLLSGNSLFKNGYEQLDFYEILKYINNEMKKDREAFVAHRYNALEELRNALQKQLDYSRNRKYGNGNGNRSENWRKNSTNSEDFNSRNGPARSDMRNQTYGDRNQGSGTRWTNTAAQRGNYGNWRNNSSSSVDSISSGIRSMNLQENWRNNQPNTSKLLHPPTATDSERRRQLDSGSGNGNGSRNHRTLYTNNYRERR